MTSVGKVRVPADFGVEYLDCPSHGNLKFLLKGGEELLANSTVMSFNSPTIKKLTTQNVRRVIEIDVRAYSKEAVKCFLEASYSGKLAEISKTNFRDVNSICGDFQVSWLSEKCTAYFQSLVDAVKKDNYEDQLYVYEEALFILNNKNRSEHMNLVMDKFITSRSITRHFVTNYLRDISLCSRKSLDIILKMTGKNEYILAEVLVVNFKQYPVLTANTRYVIESLNFSAYHPNHAQSYQFILEQLERIDNPSAVDYKLIVKILRQSNSALKQIKESMSYADIPNLFHDFQNLKELSDGEALTGFMTDSTSIKNSYMMFDAAYCWLQENQANNPPTLPINKLVKTLSRVVTKNAWRPLALEYIEHKTKPWAGALSDKLQQLETVVSENQYHIARSVSKYTPDELFSRNHDIKFRFKEVSCINCDKTRDSGFIFHVTAESEDTPFNMKLITKPDLYPNSRDFPRDFTLTSPTNLHVAMEIVNHNGNGNRSVTWYGRPCRDRTGKFWCWGPYRFCKKGQGVSPTGDLYKQCVYYGSEVKIRLVVYISL